MCLSLFRSMQLVVYWILFENVMSLHRTRATFIGLFESGRVNEWIVTEKLGDALKTKKGSKSLKKLQFRVGERYNLLQIFTSETERFGRTNFLYCLTWQGTCSWAFCRVVLTVLWVVWLFVWKEQVLRIPLPPSYGFFRRWFWLCWCVCSKFLIRIPDLFSWWKFWFQAITTVKLWIGSSLKFFYTTMCISS